MWKFQVSEYATRQEVGAEPGNAHCCFEGISLEKFKGSALFLYRNRQNRARERDPVPVRFSHVFKLHRVTLRVLPSLNEVGPDDPCPEREIKLSGISHRTKSTHA